MADKPQSRNTNKKTLLRDVLLAVFLLALGLSAFFIVQSNRKGGATVEVYHDGEKIAAYSLLQNATYEINGGTHTLVIENGAAYVKDADCPTHICEKRGKIKNVGESIVCLPNRVEVRVVGASDVDLSLN